MGLLNRLERLFGRFAVPNLSLYLVVGQVAVWGLALLGGFDVERLKLLPEAVRAGEGWRLFTFLLVPPNSSPLFIAFAWYMFFLMGGALEEYWGEFRYSAFLFTGWLLTVAAAFLVPGYYASNLFLAGSVFLAFAFLNPDFELLIFFLLPVKIKWLALLQWLFYGFTLATGHWSARLGVLAAVGNFLLFFGRDIVQLMKTGRRRMETQARRRSELKAEPEFRHRCHVCGKTNVTHPLMDFRYCSKCAGDECYCQEHIFHHEHVKAPAGAKK
ncbi:MAG: hypothetical protein HY302_05735 [Opitutae bacterium]|nr:hypothetical protein [Opitutae bacterium]